MAKDGVSKQELVESLKQLDEKQDITLIENDDMENSHAATARNVSIYYGENSGDHHQPSHYVTTKTCVDYKWEKTFYYGHLTAVHMSGKVFAHILQTHHAGKVRITVDESANDGRCLLKDFEGALVDVDFAKVPEEFIVACMEENGTCTVYSIETKKPVSATLLVQIRMNDSASAADIICRAIWCTHVPESGEKPVFQNSLDPSNQLILTCGGRAVVVSVPLVQNAAGVEKKVTLEKNPNCKGVISTAPGANIWDAKMSPDGIVLCVARQDGNVHFYQCDLKKGEQDATMVYTWVPHDGKPVHTVNFFDDLSTDTQQEQFWMFALSGSEFGRQFRLWNCQHWHCMQTIDILPSPSRPLNLPSLQALVDPKGEYLILADTAQNILLFLRVDKDLIARHALVKSVNEFLVGSPILNFSVVELDVIRPEQSSEGAETGFRARLLTLHSNTLQHMNVTFVGEHLPPVMATSENIPPDSCLGSGDATKKSDNSAVYNKLNGEAKRQRKKARKNRDHSSSNEVSESTDVSPQSNHEKAQKTVLSGLDDILSHSPQQKDSGAESPAFVLQPPSAFDSIVSVRRTSSQQGSPIVSASTSKENNIESGDDIFLTPSSSQLKREERSTASNLGSFGLPPVEEPVPSMGLNGGSRGSRASSYQNLASTEKDRVTWVGHRDYDESRAAVAANHILSERITRLETTLNAVGTVIDHQSQVLDMMARSVDEMKKSKSEKAILDKAITKSLDGLSQSLQGPMQTLSGLENRISGSMSTWGKTLQDNVGKEVKSQLTQKSLKPLGDKIVQDVQTQLAGIDTGFKAKVEEVVKSKQFTTAIAQNVAAPFSEIAKKAVQDVISGQLPGVLQTAINASLVTLNQAFSNGTKEYLSQVNQCMNNHFTQMEECFDDRIRKVETAASQACSSAIEAAAADLMKTTQEMIHKNMEHLYSQIMTNLGTQLSQKLNVLVREELREHQSVMHESLVQAVRSGIATPGGQGLSQQYRAQQAMNEVKTALAKQDYNTAFRIALSASDLNLVLFVCEKVNVKEIFGDTEVLQMPVLFSLIQQLAVDIGSKTELKLQYLQEALLAIQAENLDSGSFKFLRTVLGDVTKALNKFLQANAGHALSRTIRMVSQNANLQLMQINALHTGKD